ncbi:MAG: substrate-binding domain-containing protein [Oceanipulchritudo sp.]
MRLAIAVYSTYTFSSRLLAGFLAYCREHPEVRPRIIRLQDGADAREHFEDFEGDALVLGYRFRQLVESGWRPAVPAIIQGFGVDEALDFPQVGFNNEAIGQAAARRLAGEGLSRLLFVGNRASTSSPVRWRGFRAAGREMGLPVAFFGDGPSQRGRKRILLKLQMADLAKALAGEGRPLGVFATDDNHGERVIEAAQLAGLRVPGDVAVLCVSSTPLLCEWCRPALSAFHLDHEAQGRTAAEWAHRAALDGPPDPPHRTAPWRFVERESSAHLIQSDPTVARALEFMSTKVGTLTSMAEVAAAIHTSKRTLERRFRAVLGRGPSEALRALRLRTTLDLLTQADLPLKEVAARAGWADPGHMGRAVKQETGLTPARYRLQFGRPGPDA